MPLSRLDGVQPWLIYGIIRLSLFAVALTVLLIAGIEGWIAALIAAAIGLCIAYIFFRPQRDAIVSARARADRSAARSDEAAEDA